jgi:hypothetical protein
MEKMNNIKRLIGKYKKLITVMIIALFSIGFLILVLTNRQETCPHFELSGEYGLYFSNTDPIIALLHDSLAAHASAVTISYNAEGNYMDEIDSMIDELMNLAMYNTASPKEGDYVRYQYGGYKLSYGYTQEDGQSAYTITITPTYYSTLTEEEQVDERVEEILEELHFDKKTSDYEKIKAIYDYVCSNVSYDYVHVHNSHYYKDSTAYAALLKGSASCQGYAVTMFRLLKEAGIENQIVTGTAVNAQGEDEFHAWNKVELNEMYYNIDATWDAGKEEYDFFMLSDEEFMSHQEE